VRNKYLEKLGETKELSKFAIYSNKLSKHPHHKVTTFKKNKRRRKGKLNLNKHMLLQSMEA